MEGREAVQRPPHREVRRSGAAGNDDAEATR